MRQAGWKSKSEIFLNGPLLFRRVRLAFSSVWDKEGILRETTIAEEADNNAYAYAYTLDTGSEKIPNLRLWRGDGQANRRHTRTKNYHIIITRS